MSFYIPEEAAEVGVTHCTLVGLSLSIHPQELPYQAGLPHLGIAVKQSRHDEVLMRPYFCREYALFQRIMK